MDHAHGGGDVFVYYVPEGGAGLFVVVEMIGTERIK